MKLVKKQNELNIKKLRKVMFFSDGTNLIWMVLIDIRITITAQKNNKRIMLRCQMGGEFVMIWFAIGYKGLNKVCFFRWQREWLEV